MESRRLDLQSILEGYCDNVYFVQPTNYASNTGFTMKYPAIVYSLSKVDKRSADSMAYTLINKYSVTYITSDPTTEIPYQMLEDIPYCSMDGVFRNDNLHHFAFTIYN